MLEPTMMTWRLTLHVLAATIWVGGQFLLAGAVKPLRAVSDDAVKAVARTFSLLAWPAFVVLILTGVWNLFAMRITDQSVERQVTVLVKILVAMISGVGAGIHQIAAARAERDPEYTSKLGFAVGGTLGSLGAVAALFLGLLIRTGVG